MNGNAMNINDDSPDSQMIKVIRDIKNNDAFGANGQDMRGQLLNRLQNILPLFNNLEEVDAGHNGILPRREYFELWKRDLDEYLDQRYMGENGIIDVDGLAESIVSEAYTIIEHYINNPQGGRRRRRAPRKTRKSRKTHKRRPKSHRRRN
jgi:hypothetical protein